MPPTKSVLRLLGMNAMNKSSEAGKSFSSRVKSELAGLKIRRREDARALLCAFTLCIGSLKYVPQKRCWGVHYSLKSRDAIELCAKLCAQYYALECSISEVVHERLNANNCELIVYGSGADDFLRSVGLLKVDADGEREYGTFLPEDAVLTDTQHRSFIRGMFLACGMAADPEKNYHIEFVTNNEALAGKTADILALYGIPINRSSRKNSIVLYVKEGEKLEDLLAFMGASEAMMHVSNERIIKQAKNRANRYVNCISANTNRATQSAQKQIADIEFVLKTLGVEALSEELRTVAEARLENVELTLSELADELNMGRSAVNYRLKKLQKLASDLRGKAQDT